MSYQKETEVVVVLVTAPDERAGLAIARTLVGEKLAAFVKHLTAKKRRTHKERAEV
jgi:uncharacterized protein involved in tolerance to divalent cations